MTTTMMSAATTLSNTKKLHQCHWLVASYRHSNNNHNWWRIIVVLLAVFVVGSSRALCANALLMPKSRFAQQRLASGNEENVLVLGNNNVATRKMNRCGWKRTALAAAAASNHENNDEDDTLNDHKNHDASSWAAKEYQQKLRDAERAIAQAEEARIRYEAVQREEREREEREQQQRREQREKQQERDLEEQSLSNSNNAARRRSTRNADSFVVSSPSTHNTNEDDKWEEEQAFQDEMTIPGTSISKTDAGTLVMEWAAPGVDSKALFSGAFSAAWFSAIVPITLTGGASLLLFTVPFWLAGGLVAKQAVVNPWVASRLTVGDHLWTLTRWYAGKTVQQREGATETLRGVRPHLAVVVNGAPQYELKLLDQQHQAMTTASIPVPNVSKDELLSLANIINGHLDDIRKRNGGSETTPPFPPLSDWEDSSSFQ